MWCAVSGGGIGGRYIRPDPTPHDLPPDELPPDELPTDALPPEELPPDALLLELLLELATPHLIFGHTLIAQKKVDVLSDKSY